MCLEERLDAVERALTDGEDGPATLSDVPSREERLDDLEERIAELEAATHALRGYVGNVRTVNREVQETAEAARATAERVERRLDAEQAPMQWESTNSGRVEREVGRATDRDGGADDPAERLVEWARDAL